MTKEQAIIRLKELGEAMISVEVANEMVSAWGIDPVWVEYNQETGEGDPSVSTVQVREEIQNNMFLA
jgi:hypothetical protein